MGSSTNAVTWVSRQGSAFGGAIKVAVPNPHTVVIQPPEHARARWNEERLRRQFFNDVAAKREGLLRMGYRMTLCVYVAEDLAQETILRAYASYDKYSESQQLDGWLFTILGNLCRDLIRAHTFKKHAELTVEMASEDPDSETMMWKREEAAQVRRAVSGLATPYREAIQEKFWEENSYADMAQEAGRDPATMRKRVSRGLRFLQEVWPVEP